jgi:hypothetical protein
MTTYNSIWIMGWVEIEYWVILILWVVFVFLLTGFVLNLLKMRKRDICRKNIELIDAEIKRRKHEGRTIRKSLNNR